MTRKLLLAGWLTVLVVMVLPLVFTYSGDNCPVNVAGAQENPCADQEATITALFEENQTLKLTIEAGVIVVTATPQAPPALGFAAPTLEAVPENCIDHEVIEGETLASIADQYAISIPDLMDANDLDESSAAMLQVGDVLTIPLDKCNLDFESLATPSKPLLPTDTPMQVVEVAGVGDVTAESVRIRNDGPAVDLSGWTLSDEDGNVYTFESVLLFNSSELTIYTRAGESTPVALYWGLDSAVWSPGEQITLTDANGDIQALYTVP